MKNDFQLNLGELLHIKFSDGRKCQAVAQLIRDREIWTQQFVDPSSGLEGKEVEVQIIRDKRIWTPKYLSAAHDNNLDKFQYCNDLRLHFRAMIQKNDVLQGMRMTKIERTSTISRIQRRKSYRLNIFFDVQLRERGMKNGYKKCQGVNISEAGIGVQTTHSGFKLGDALDCLFTLDELEYYFPATVVRRKELQEGTYCLGLKFNIEKESQVRFIRRYIYKKQIGNK